MNWEAVTEAERTAVRAILEHPTFELVPATGLHGQAVHLPPASSVSVVCLPAKGIAATIDASVSLASAGFEVVPHLAARAVRDTAHLDAALARIQGAGITSLFVVGGDGDPIGPYGDAASLLDGIADIAPGWFRIGIAGYPEGHPSIPDQALLAAMRTKASHAAYIVSQMSFDAAAIEGLAARAAQRGVGLPVEVGVPGVADRTRLIRLGARIGVGDSLRYLRKNRSMLGRMLSGSSFRPDELLADLAPALAAQPSRWAGLHIYTFNACEATEAWRRGLLEDLSG